MKLARNFLVAAIGAAGSASRRRVLNSDASLPDDILTAVIMAVCALQAAANEHIVGKFAPDSGVEFSYPDHILEEENLIRKYGSIAITLGKAFHMADFQKKIDCTDLRLLLVVYDIFQNYVPSDKHQSARMRNIIKCLVEGGIVPVAEQASGESDPVGVFMCGACAQWAVRTVMDFSTAFSGLTGLPDPLLPASGATSV